MQEVSIDYNRYLDGLDNVVRSCCHLSRECGGWRSPTSQHFYASVLFTTLCTRGVSLLILAPRSKWSEKIIDHWDYASFAILTRSILEVRLMFNYLCIDKVGNEEWECRWNLLNLHDCCSRLLILDSQSGKEKWEKEHINLKNRLERNSFFKSLPEKQRKKLLIGRHAYLLSLEDIAERSGINKNNFKFIYRLLSYHVHSLPLSFYNMDSQERGRGLYGDVEENYILICISTIIQLMTSAWDEMLTLFYDLLSSSK